MCTPFVALFATISCFFQTIVEIIAHILKTIECIVVAILQTIYNLTIFLLQIVAIIPTCCIFCIASRLRSAICCKTTTFCSILWDILFGLLLLAALLFFLYPYLFPPHAKKPPLNTTKPTTTTTTTTTTPRPTTTAPPPTTTPTTEAPTTTTTHATTPKTKTKTKFHWTLPQAYHDVLEGDEATTNTDWLFQTQSDLATNFDYHGTGFHYGYAG